MPPPLVALAAAVFAFTDLDGFEACLKTDHVVEKVKTAAGSETRVLDAAEVQLRCIDAAVKVIAPAKRKDLDLAFIASTRRLSAPINALDLASVLVDHGLDNCNDLAAYELITEALSRARNDDRTSVFARGKALARRCLKDKTFVVDFKDEQSKPDPLGANACELLREEKLVSTCKERP